VALEHAPQLDHDQEFCACAKQRHKPKLHTQKSIAIHVPQAALSQLSSTSCTSAQGDPESRAAPGLDEGRRGYLLHPRVLRLELSTAALNSAISDNMRFSRKTMTAVAAIVYFFLLGLFAERPLAIVLVVLGYLVWGSAGVIGAVIIAGVSGTISCMPLVESLRRTSIRCLTAQFAPKLKADRSSLC
jgi:hypothetical protein